MVHIYTDASLNTGLLNVGGIGVYFEAEIKRNISKVVRHEFMTIQSIEVEAIFAALIALRDNEHATIFSDSQHAVNCLTVQYNTLELNNWKNAKNKPIVAAKRIKQCKTIIVNREFKGIQTDLKFVYGHSGNPGNDVADRLAGTAAESVRPKVQKVQNIVQATLQHVPENISNYVANSIDSMPNKKTKKVTSDWDFGSIDDTYPSSVVPDIPVASKLPELVLGPELPESSNYSKEAKRPLIVQVDQEINIEVDKDIYWYKPKSPIMNILTEDNEISVKDSFNKYEDDVLYKDDSKDTNEDTNEDILSNPEVEVIADNLKELNQLSRLFLVCIECSELILIEYPSEHIISPFVTINNRKADMFAITKCRECITSKTGNDLAINVSKETEQQEGWINSLRISDRLFIGSPAYIAAESIVDNELFILTQKDIVQYISITLISKLCGKDCKSVTINIEKKKKRHYLQNGFL